MGTICSVESDDAPVIRLRPNATTNSADVYDLAANVNVTLKTQQNLIELNQSISQTIPVLLKIDVGRIATSQRAPIDIVLVLDHSGSMDGERMELAKDACYDLLQYLGPEDRVGLVKFDDEATEVTKIMPMTEINKTVLKRDIMSIEADGGTNIAHAIRLAVKMLHRRKYVNAVSSIFLLSDGEDEGADERVRNLLLEYAFTDVFTINTFGLSEHHDPEVMMAIADEKDGNFYFIEDVSTIDQCFADCLGGLLSVVADNVKVAVQAVSSELLPGIRISKTYGVVGDWQQTGDIHTKTIAHLTSGRETNSVFEIRIPSTAALLQEGVAQLKIASAQVMLQGLNYNNGQRASVVKNVDLIVSFVNPGIQIQQIVLNGDVIFNHFRVRKAELLMKVYVACGQGQLNEAKAMLRSLIEEMENSVIDVDSNQRFEDLIKDAEAALLHVQNFRNGGRHHLLQHHRNHMHERSNIHSTVKYGNQMQNDMVLAARNKKVYGQPGPFGQPIPYGQPSQYGQPGQYGQSGQYPY